MGSKRRKGGSGGGSSCRSASATAPSSGSASASATSTSSVCGNQSAPSSAEAQQPRQAPPSAPGPAADIKFPARLHYVLKALEDDGSTDVMAWQPDGRSFRIVDRDRLVREVLPK